MAELVIGGALLDHDGTVLWDQGGNGAGPTLGTNAATPAASPRSPTSTATAGPRS
jgi:hypothetical protein